MIDYMGFQVKTMLQTKTPEGEGGVAALKRDIVSGVLAPGEPLRLMALSKRYGVGYTPLREALSRFEEAGLVVLSPNRGYRVAPVSFAELEDLEQSRALIEVALLEDAIVHGDLAWEAAIVAAHHRLARASAALDDGAQAYSEWMEAHDAFHAALLAAARSVWLKSFQRQLSEQLRRHHHALLFSPADAGGEVITHDPATRALLEEALALEGHTRLMDAALARDVDHAATLLRAHVQFTLAVHRAASGGEGE